MTKIIFTRGIQGSGKSTWAKEFCEKNTDWVRVCRDDIRNMRGKYWLPKDEDIVSEWEINIIVHAILRNKNVIVDAMNLNKDRDIKGKLAKIKDWLTKNSSVDLKSVYIDKIKDFTDVPLEECQRRNLIRPNSIDPEVIQKTYDKYLAPDPVKYEEDTSLTPAIIVDVDGTLAKMNGRSPYDWDRVDEDLPNYPIIDLVQTINDSSKDNSRVIIFTGRDGSALDKTTEWLTSNGIFFDEIYIRPEGDQRKDSIVKKEMFDNYIRGNYFIKYVIDDRDQVVDMWRKELGLTCLQVDYGNF